MKNRDVSLDMVKGWLIICLVFHHISDIGLYKVGYEDNVVLNLIEQIGNPLYACYFMQTFFVITGFCSTFDKELKPFILNQFKGLLVPTICFTLVYQIYYCGISDFPRIVKQIVVYGGDFWFLYAMFSCKVAYYLLYRFVPKRWLMPLLLMVCLIGSLLNVLNLVPNYFWHRQILDFILFVGIGHQYKEKLMNIPLLKVGFAYIATVGLAYALCGNNLPMVTAGFNSSLLCWPLHLMLSLFGTLSVIALARKVKVDDMTASVGRKSMMVFIIQVYANGYFLHLFKDKLTSGIFMESTIAVLVIVCSIVSLAVVIEYILDHSLLRFMLGKPIKLKNKSSFTPPISEININTFAYSVVL